MTNYDWDFETAPSAPARPQGFSPPVGQTVIAPAPPARAVAMPPRTIADPAPTPGGERWGWRAALAFLLGGLLAAAGFGVGQLENSDGGDEAQPTTTTVANAAPSSGPIVVSPPDLDTGEPVSFVAALLGPSVVQIETDVGLGSGVIFDDGMILTNHHVIEGAARVRVRLSDGRTLDATVRGSDPRTDIAVVTAGVGRGLPIATLALEREVEVGELTIAIGSPFQLQQTVTSGIVSAVNRPIFNGTNWNAMIQTDAAINPGNSGGVLADRLGEVIGINTAIQTDGVSNTNAGIGFAMPISTAHDIATRIINGENLEPGFLGVNGGDPGPDEVGVEIVEVTEGSAAAIAGVKVGDLVLSIDDAPVIEFFQLAGLIQTSFPGDEVELLVLREGEQIRLSVTLGER